MESREELDHSQMNVEVLVDYAGCVGLRDKVEESRFDYVRSFRVWVYRTVNEKDGWEWSEFTGIYSVLSTEQKILLAQRFKVEVDTCQTKD